jgi:8-oxo-dGTP pyrophosphatase MutT (NUDIX family)
MKTRHQNTPAVYLVLINKNEVLLLRRFNTGYADGKYNMIAGHVEPNESFTDAVIREAKEEAGITLSRHGLHIAHIMHRKCPNAEYIDTFFVAKNWTGEITNKEPHKCDDLSWFSLSELPVNIMPYISQAILCVTSGIFYSEYGWINAKNQVTA